MTNFPEENNETSDLIRRYEANLRGDNFHFFDSYDYAAIAEYYISNFQEKKAQNAINEGLIQYPEAVELQYKQVEVFTLQGLFTKALRLIDRLIEDNVSDVESYLLKGTVFCALGKYQEANIIFQKGINYESDEENKKDLYFRIGLAFQHVLEFSLALQYHYKLYETVPEDLENLFEIAYCYEKLEHFENCIKFYNKYLDIEPYSDKVWYNLGIIYNRLERYSKAVEAYDYALAIHPNHSKAFFNKGNALYYLKRYKEALNCYFTYLNYEDDHSFTNTYIAECYEKMGEFQSAILHYNRALEIDNNLSDALFGLGMVAKLQGNPYEAIHYMERAAKADQTYAECHAQLGELYELIGEDALAINAYRYATIAEPGILQYHLDIAKYYHKRGDILQARDVLKSIQNDFSEDAELFYYLALFSLLLNQKKLAKRYLIQAQNIDNEQIEIIINYCKRNKTLVNQSQIDELLNLK